MKRTLASALVFVMLAALLAGCGGGQQGTTAINNEDLMAQNDESVMGGDVTANGVVRDEVTIAFTGATSLTPWGTTNSTPGNFEVYECLYEITDTGERFAVLADETRGEFGGYDHEEGSSVYTVYIYDYIYDHKGNHVDADDVVFSFTHQMEKEVTSGWGDFVKAEAVDPTTIRFTFTEEQNNLGEFDNFFGRCFIVDEDTWNSSPTNLLAEMIGTGPYVMDHYVSGSSLVLKANPNYWQTDETHRHRAQWANVNTVTYKFIDDASTRIMSLKTGEVDISDDITTANAVDFMDGGEFGNKYNVYSYMSKEIGSFWLNCSPESLCGDLNMRLAVYYAVDVEGLVALNNGTDVPGFCWATSYYSDYHPEWESMENYNTYRGQDGRAELVKSYLDAAGYDGTPLVFIYQSDQSAIATIVIGMLDIYGIKVDARGTDHAGATSLEADPTAWDMEFGKWAGSYNADAWLHAYDWALTPEGDHTTNYIYDQEWQDLLMELQTQDGHTYENMTRWLEIMYENAYGMNLYCETKNIVYPEGVLSLYRNDKLHILPGACVYASES